MNATPMLRKRMTSLATAFAMAIVLNSNAGAQDDLTPDVARNLAKEAWVFGLPLVMFEKQIDYLSK